MYGKLFASMYDGSLWGNWKAMITFQQMIVLCGPDGVIDMTPQALAARTSIPLDVIQEGIEILEAPDRYSRTPDHEGRRIERLDSHRPWGWSIVNYMKYRSTADAATVREQNRIRQQRRRERDGHGPSRSVTLVTPGHAKSRQAEAEAEGKERETDAPALVKNECAGFAEFWDAYPRKVSRKRAVQAYKRIKPDQQLLARMLSALSDQRQTDAWRKEDGRYIPHPATWLSDHRWEDGPPADQGPLGGSQSLKANNPATGLPFSV